MTTPTAPARRVYFFGDASGPGYEHRGHYLYEPGYSAAGTRWAVREPRVGPWKVETFDTGMLDPMALEHRWRDDQIQSQARLHHLDGWTALSMWDRTGDPRYACNSTLIAEGTLDFNQMEALFATTFPVLWERINGAAAVTSHPSNPRHAPAPAVVVELPKPVELQGDPLDRILAMVDAAPVEIGEPAPGLLELEMTLPVQQTHHR